MKVDWKKVFSIYATFGIPLLYLYNMYLAYAFPHTLHVLLYGIVVGFFLSIVGCILWIVSYWQLGSSFGVLPQKQERVRSGLYKYLRHPMYLGIFLTLVGLSFLRMSLPGLLFTLIITLPILLVRAYFEEKYLN